MDASLIIIWAFGISRYALEEKLDGTQYHIIFFATLVECTGEIVGPENSKNSNCPYKCIVIVNRGRTESE